jgi:hypothetical protein
VGAGSDRPQDELPEAESALVEAWAARQKAFEDDWYTRHTGAPSVLYHYTDAAGFLGIVQSNELWASHAGFLNDSTELIYVREVLREVLDEFEEDEASEAASEFGRQLMEELESLSYDVYVACFCENGDLLSQWRGYPPAGGGYSIGVSGRRLIQTEPPRRVIYDRDEQRSVIRRLLGAIKETLAEFSSADRATLAGFKQRITGQALYSLTECSFCFKHPAFEEEREWRVVVLIHRDSAPGDGARASLFRATHTGLLPYTSIRLAERGLPTSERAISEVVIGPGRHPDLAAKAAERLLKSAGHPNAGSMVQHSAVPLRV